MAVSEHTQTLPTPQSAIERRCFLTMAGGLAAATATAGAVAVSAAKAGQHPDAELIRLGSEFRERYQEWDRCLLVQANLYQADPAFVAAGLREAAAYEAMQPVADAIRKLPATTPAGFVVRLYVLAHDLFTTEFSQQMPWYPDCDDDDPLMSLTRQMERLAASEAAS